MTQFLHDVGLFAGGWIAGWIMLNVWPMIRQFWTELRNIPREWKGNRHE